MFKILRSFFGFIGLLVVAAPGFSQPYLNIQSINADNYPYVQLEVSVRNVAPLENLNETNFSVFEDGWKAGFFRIKKTDPEKSPKKLVILVDSSLSVPKDAFAAQIQAARILINSIYKNDQISIISFNDSVEVRCGFTSSREQLSDCLKGIRQNGKHTVLYDAIYKAFRLLSENPVERRYVVLYTDGKEEESGIKLDELEKFPEKSSLFIAGTGKKPQLGKLANLARISGGEIYQSQSIKNLGEMYSLLQSLMDNTYQLEFISQGLTKEKFQRERLAEVRFESGEIRDQAQKSFSVPVQNFSDKIRNVIRDERFILFVIVFLLIVIIFILIVIKPRRREKTIPAEVIEEVPVKASKRSLSSGKTTAATAEKKQEAYRSRAFIIQKEGPATGATHQIRFQTTTIGHGNENSVVIDDPSVSYTHAKIVEKDGSFYIYDMLSESGVYVNGKKTLKPRMLNDFDEIRLGRTLFLFRKAYK